MIPHEDPFSIAPLVLKMPGWFFRSCAPCCGAGCQQYVSEGFDGTLAGWTQVSGTWSITSSTVQTSSSNALLVRDGLNITSTNISLFSSVTNGVNGDEGRIIFGRQDSSNYYYAKVLYSSSATNEVFAIYRVSGGVHTKLRDTGSRTLAARSAVGVLICYSRFFAIASFSTTSGTFDCSCDVDAPMGGIGFETVTASGPLRFGGYTITDVGNGDDCASCTACGVQCTGDMPETVEVTLPSLSGSAACCSQLSGDTFVLTRTSYPMVPPWPDACSDAGMPVGHGCCYKYEGTGCSTTGYSIGFYLYQHDASSLGRTLTLLIVEKFPGALGSTGGDLWRGEAGLSTGQPCAGFSTSIALTNVGVLNCGSNAVGIRNCTSSPMTVTVDL